MSSPSTENKQSQQAQRAGPAHISFAINTSMCLRKHCLFSMEAGDSSTQSRPVPHMVPTQPVLRGAMRKGQTLSQMPLLSQKYHFRWPAISKIPILTIVSWLQSDPVESSSLGGPPSHRTMRGHSRHSEKRLLYQPSNDLIQSDYAEICIVLWTGKIPSPSQVLLGVWPHTLHHETSLVWSTASI